VGRRILAPLHTALHSAQCREVKFRADIVINSALAAFALLPSLVVSCDCISSDIVQYAAEVSFSTLCQSLSFQAEFF
jgi:hypothetical protein